MSSISSVVTSVENSIYVKDRSYNKFVNFKFVLMSKGAILLQSAGGVLISLSDMFIGLLPTPPHPGKILLSVLALYCFTIL